MAIYEYRCAKCAAEFEAMRPMSEADDPAPCPHCGSEGVRLPSVFASGKSYEIHLPAKEAFRGPQNPPKG